LKSLAGSGGGAGEGGSEESTDDEETKKKKQQQTAAAAIQQIMAKTPPGAEIDYLYDIGGESIFAPMKTQSKYHPREGYYDPYVEKNMAQGGSIDDLYDLLRSK